MNSKTLKSFLLGAISAYSLVAVVLISAAGLGIVPVQADMLLQAGWRRLFSAPRCTRR
jgi:hypothetical protein